jgi:LmbE family N-acetylglucosaminyl deacetylase
MSASGALEPPGSWRPLLLPHLELGEPGPAFTEGERAALARCRGEEPLDTFEPAARSAIETARCEGLVAYVPPRRERNPPVRPALVVSPHPDDAVLSLGALIASTGATVANVFSVETWSPRRFYAERPELTARLVIAEEEAACRVLGAAVEFLGFEDAPLRGVPADATIGVAETAETWRARLGSPLVREVADALRNRCAAAETVYAPAGVGGHVDHLTCLAAVARLVGDGEDLPYAIMDRSPRPPPDEVRTAGEEAWLAKSEALRAYRVQLRSGMRPRVMAHGRSLGERLWAFRGGGGAHGHAAHQPVADAGHRDDPRGRADAR